MFQATSDLFSSVKALYSKSEEKTALKNASAPSFPTALDTAANFTEKDLLSLDRTLIPKHIAIIPDGNRRWAKSQNMLSTQGHLAGAEATVVAIKAAKELGIKVVTIFTWSTENWMRHALESAQFLKLLETYLMRYQEALVRHKIRLSTIGEIEKLPKNLLKIVNETKQLTAQGDELELVLAINYGGRDELKRAMKAIADDVWAGKLSPNDLSDDLISKYLDTKGRPDPDLIIRTSGEMRLSNFLLWQASYSEFYSCSKPWPAFTPQDLFSAVLEYQKRERRFGGNGDMQNEKETQEPQALENINLR